MTNEVDNSKTGEFTIDFAAHYEALSDAFIDIKGAADSLKKLIGESRALFELGLGTGYFAKQFFNDGYEICGIQPKDGMLARLRQECPQVKVLAEKYLQEYDFSGQQYDVIVSHSSVFLFTKLESVFAAGETQTMLVFQSSIKDEIELLKNLTKVLAALSPKGRLFINIQTNPPKIVLADYSYEQLKCEYNFDCKQAVKKIVETVQGKPQPETEEKYYVLRYSDFKTLVESLGGQTQISDDYQWVIVKRVASFQETA
jgi:phospholipid N-methyltransferase